MLIECMERWPWPKDSTGDVQGPPVQSIVNLTSFWMRNLLNVVAKKIKYINIFGCKNVRSFCNAKATHIFSEKHINVFAIFQIEILMSR